jgi:NADPH-dependent curcumin reductase CurA
MVEFVREKKLGVVVSKAVKGLTIEACEEVFEIMKEGKQFGKLVVKIADEEKISAKL